MSGSPPPSPAPQVVIRRFPLPTVMEMAGWRFVAIGTSTESILLSVPFLDPRRPGRPLFQLSHHRPCRSRLQKSVMLYALLVGGAQVAAMQERSLYATTSRSLTASTASSSGDDCSSASTLGQTDTVNIL